MLWPMSRIKGDISHILLNPLWSQKDNINEIIWYWFCDITNVVNNAKSFDDCLPGSSYQEQNKSRTRVQEYISSDS